MNARIPYVFFCIIVILFLYGCEPQEISEKFPRQFEKDVEKETPPARSDPVGVEDTRPSSPPIEKTVSPNKEITREIRSSQGIGSSSNDAGEDSHWQKIGQGNLAGLSSCGERNVLFTTFPVDLDNFLVITPLGSVGATAHLIPTQHLFLRPRRAGVQQDYTLETDVVASVDMRIYMITGVEDVSAVKTFETDYALYFSPCTEVVGYFDHVWDLSPKLHEAWRTAEADFCNDYTLIYDKPVDWRFCKKKVVVDVKRGEYLGKTGGKGHADVFDFALFDYRHEPHPYTNKEQWRNYGNTFEEAFYVTCPLNYFPDVIREEAEAKLGAEHRRRTIQPICGEVFQDIGGTAQGVWFSDQNKPGSRHLSLVHDVIDPRKPVLVIGEGLDSIHYGDYFYVPKETGFVNRDFSAMVVDYFYCLGDLHDKSNNPVQGKIILQLPTTGTLLLEWQDGTCGSGPWEFKGKESRFER